MREKWTVIDCLVCLMLFSFAESSIFVTDLKMNKMIELNARKPHCRLHTDRGSIQKTVLNTNTLKIRQVPDETIQTLEQVCFAGKQVSEEIQGAFFGVIYNVKRFFILTLIILLIAGGLSFVS